MAGVFTLACRQLILPGSHYGRFWQNLTINYGMNFDFSGCIFIIFFENYWFQGFQNWGLFTKF